MDSRILTEFQKTGRALAEAGLTTGESGNLSLRQGKSLFITTHGSNLSRLGENDVTATGIYADDENTPLASSELAVHRAIYMATDAKAIVHAHPAHAVALTLADTRSKSISQRPVIGHNLEIVPGALHDEIAAALKKCPLVVVRGHGTFAIGDSFEAALGLSIAFEDGCQGLCKSKGITPKRVEG